MRRHILILGQAPSLCDFLRNDIPNIEKLNNEINGEFVRACAILSFHIFLLINKVLRNGKRASSIKERNLLDKLNGVRLD